MRNGEVILQQQTMVQWETMIICVSVELSVQHARNLSSKKMSCFKSNSMFTCAFHAGTH